MIKAPIIGHSNKKPVAIDIPILLETRMLVQGSSGSGKSWALRRLLEESAKTVQQIVIDTEGEFVSLREKYDYLIASAEGGDFLAHPSIAAVLARKMLELRVNVVININDLRKHDRQLFVEKFLTALMSAPKTLRNQLLLVIDEAHLYAPESGRGADCKEAVIDVATRGRKLGFGLVLATQRLPQLDKTVAAQMLNKLIGHNELDIDVNRAGDTLGMIRSDAKKKLRLLMPGSFYAYGPAISRSVQLVKIAQVKTTHPKPGQRKMIKPAPPSKKMLKALVHLKELPKEAEEEARTLDEFRKSNAALKKENSAHVRMIRKMTASPPVKKVGISEKEVERRINAVKKQYEQQNRRIYKLATEEIKTIRKGEEVFRLVMEKLIFPMSRIELKIQDVLKPLKLFSNAFAGNPRTVGAKLPSTFREFEVLPGIAGVDPSATDIKTGNPHSDKPYIAPSRPPAPVSIEGLPDGAARIFKVIASHYPVGLLPSQIGLLVKRSFKSGTSKAYMRLLKKDNYIRGEGNLIYAVKEAIEAAGLPIPSPPSTHKEAMDLWLNALPEGAGRFLEIIAASTNSGISRNELGQAVGRSFTSGTSKAYVRMLKANDLTVERDGVLFPAKTLFPAGDG